MIRHNMFSARKLYKINWSHISNDQRKQEEARAFEKDITFSILVPLYNTPIAFLDEMIESVKAQTYAKWELCLADGSDDKHPEVGAEVLRLAAQDTRIKYRKLEKNLGISENTNACIDIATGNFIALFDHDDILHPSALYRMMCAICEQNADFVYTDEATFESPNIRRILHLHYKSDYAVDTLRANNYICHFSAFSRELLVKAGRFRSEFDGSQDHDMILRLTSHAKNVVHIPEILYFWRSHPNSVAMDINSKTYAITAGQRAVADSIRAHGYEATVTSAKAFPTIYRIKYELKPEKMGRVSIMIPSRDHAKTLRNCIRSILELTTYPDYEILIIDNASCEQELLDYYEELKKDPRIRILHDDRPFNFSAMNNGAAKEATGDYLMLMNNDIEIITPDWIQELMMYAQRDDIGAVGGKLYFPNNRIQHAGVTLKLGGDRIAGHTFYGEPRDAIGYMGKLDYAQNLSAVTAAFMMVRKSVWDELCGMDEDFPVSFNDIDFCLRIREKRYLIVWTPGAEAYHHESLTRGIDKSDKRKAPKKDANAATRKKRFQEDCQKFRTRWATVLEEGDPYYNPNFSLDLSYQFDLSKHSKKKTNS